MVAFRGLWDKFAAPLTTEAIFRSYSRGVPSLIRCADGGEVSRALDVLSSAECNRGLQPILLVFDGSPAIVCPHIPSDVSPRVMAIDGSALFDRTYPIYRWTDGAWSAVGSYVPIAAYLRGLTADDLAIDGNESLVVMFESVNVIDDVRLSPSPEGLDDDAVYASVRSLVGATADVVSSERSRRARLAAPADSGGCVADVTLRGSPVRAERVRDFARRSSFQS